jgi:hypothetical protein
MVAQLRAGCKRARAASEVEPEWLYRVLTERYALPAG